MAYITNEIKTVTGTSVSIPDSDQRQIVDLILQGDTYQKTTTQSNQLVNINSSSFSTQEINGVTITNNNDGSITLNGRSTNEVALQISTEVNTPLTAGTYYLNPNKISGTGGMYSLVLTSRDGYGSIGYSTGTETTITTNRTYTKTYLYIYIFASQTFSNLVLKPILSKTSGASWEQYIEPSPSPDYPQPINVVSGRQEVVVCGKNLINGTFRQGNVNGTVNNTNIFCDYNNIVVKNQQYTFSTNLDTSVYKYQIFVNNNRFPKSPSDFEEYTSGWKTTSSFTFTLSVDGYFGIGIQRIDGGNLTPNDVENVLFQLVKGTDTTYEAYKGQSYEINLGKNLINYSATGTGQDIDYNFNGSELSLNGTTSSSGQIAITSTQPITLPMGTYTFSSSTTGTFTANSKSTAIYLRKLSDNTGIITLAQNNNYTLTSTFTLTETTKVYVQIYTNGAGFVFDNFNIKWQIEKGSVATTYAPYKTPIELCKIGNHKDRIFKGKGVNLFNYGTAIRNKTFTSQDVVSDSTGLFISDYIKVEPNTAYYTNEYAPVVIGLDKNKSPLGYIRNVSFAGTFTTGTTCEYIRIRAYNTTIPMETAISNTMLNEGTTALPYEPYNSKGKWLWHKEIGKVVLDNNVAGGSLIDSDRRIAFTSDNIPALSNVYIPNVQSGTNITPSFSNYFVSSYQTDITPTNNKFGFSKWSGKVYLIFSAVYDNVADFKTWLGTHNTEVYFPLATPTTTEITDSELISQLNALQLLEGLNNISITSGDLSSPLSITYYSTDNEYYDKIYSQDERNDLKIWFNDVELEDAPIKCEKITRVARILPDDGNKVFSLDNFISTNIEVILHNVDLEDIQDQVKISIGTLMDNNTYTYIPLGVFNIQDTPENDNGKITLKLRDNRVKFDFNYNGQELIEQQGGYATKRQILDDICEKAGVTNTIDYFENESDLIGIYDNTITGTTYVSYLMEQAGLIPTIDREGNLKAIDLSEPYVWKIPLSILQTGFEIGEPYNIERVVYESGTIKYETSSDNTLNTLYLNILNPYITKNNQVEYILEKLHNFVIDSVTTKNVLGNPCIDPYDMIRVYNDLDQTNNIVFETLGNTTYTYNGTHRDIFDTQIGKEERKENVSLKGDATFQKYARTSIDNLDGKITSEVGIVGNNLDTLNKKLYGDTETQQVGDITRLETSITQKADSIEFNVYKEIVDDISENGTTKVKNTSVTINDEGLNVSTSNSKISTTMTNNEFKIIDNGGNKLAYFGYDETAQTSKAEIDNLTITTYLNTGVHRIEKYEEDGEEYTGFFYIGG